MYLKGGTLMAIAHHSERMTGDVDYSWFGEPFAPTVADEIVTSLNSSLKRASVKLGYLDLVCKIQSVRKEPHKWQKDPTYPALNISIGYAAAGSPQEKALESGNASNVLWVEISFNEKLKNAHELLLDDSNVSIKAYTPTEIIAEKMRALLQQTQRQHLRSRRQDIYDISLLIQQLPFDDEEKRNILETLHMKADSRHVIVHKDSFADEAVKTAAEKEWNTISLEMEEPLPPFPECYQIVQDFYESLPWESFSQKS